MGLFILVAVLFLSKSVFGRYLILPNWRTSETKVVHLNRSTRLATQCTWVRKNKQRSSIYGSVHHQWFTHKCVLYPQKCCHPRSSTCEDIGMCYDRGIGECYDGGAPTIVSSEVSSIWGAFKTSLRQKLIWRKVKLIRQQQQQKKSPVA